MFLHISSGGQDENEMRWLDINDGFLVINAMRELGLRPSRMSLEALLDGCAALNDSEQAHRVLQEMEREGLQLNIFSMIRYEYRFREYNLHGVNMSPVLTTLQAIYTNSL